MGDRPTRFEFTVPGTPRGKPTARAVSRGHRASVIAGKEQMVIEARILAAFLAAHPAPTPIEGPVRLTIRAYRDLPRGRERKRRPVPEGWDTAKPDGSNVQKAIEDALNGVAWVDDSQVVEWRGIKRRAAQGDHARVEVIIEEII